MKKAKAFLIIICLCFSLAVQIAAADVKLPAVFADNMVLQRKTKAPVWGWADPGEKIRIKASWRWFGTSTTADKDGNWFIKIPTPKAGG